MKQILVIGSANADLLIHTDRVPLLGETVMGRDFAVNAGGKGLNQAVAVKKLGGDVSFLGCLGQDANGDMLVEALKKYDIPFVGTRLENESTGIAVVTVVNGDNFIILHSGTNGCLTPAMAEAHGDRIRNADYILLQLEIPVETVVRIAEIAHAAGTKVILNPAPCRELPAEIYPLVDYLIPNEHEARELTGIDPRDEESCIRAMNCLLDRGVGTAVITLGERGSCAGDGKTVHFEPAVPAKAVDTTSAGDTFIGGLCTRLALGESLPRAMGYGARAAAITVSRSGAAASIPLAEEVPEI